MANNEAFHSKRDTFERDIIIGGFLSFSPVVIVVVWFYESSPPKDYYSSTNTIFGPGIILGFVLDWVIHSLIISPTIVENT